MARNDTLLILAALGIGAFALTKPLSRTGEGVADAVGGAATTISGVGKEVVNLAGDVTGNTGSLSDNVGKIFDATGESAASVLGLPAYAIGEGKENIQKIAGFVSDAASKGWNKIKQVSLPRPSIESNPNLQTGSNPVIAQAQSFLQIPVANRAAEANVEIAAATGDTSHLEVHTPLARYTGGGGSSGKSKSLVTKAKTTPAPAGSVFASTKSKSLTSAQKSELSSNLKKLGWA